jgi:Glycosyltransferase family 87
VGLTTGGGGACSPAMSKGKLFFGALDNSQTTALLLWAAVAVAWLITEPAIMNCGLWGAPDWFSFIWSGRAVAHGLNPFAPSTVPLGPDLPAGLFAANLNAPPLLPLFQLAAHLDAGLSLWVVRAFGILTLGAALWLSGAFSTRWRWALAVWLAVQGGTTHLLFEGQIYGVVALLFVLACRAPNNPYLAGCLIGLACVIKPNFVIVPALLFLSGQFGMAFMAGAVFTAVNIACAAVYGLGVYREWLDAARMAVSPLAGAATLRPLVLALGGERYWAPLTALAFIYAGWTCWHRKPSVRSVAALGVCLAIIFAPISWVGYNVIALPLLLRRTSPWLIAGLLCFIPTMPLLSAPYGLAAIFLYPIGMACLAVHAAVAASTSERRPVHGEILQAAR